jgi:predicted DNA-binding protein (MmcQ/YjbR family)
MPESGDIPPEIVARLRSVCLGLPETYEEQAWAGPRWRIRKRTFAHVLTVDSDWPPSYARAAAVDRPTCVVTFRSPAWDVDALTHAGHPFFRPAFGTDVVGMVLEGDVDWDEVAELLTESYCTVAPKKLAASVHRRSIR